jgi:general secretion pathway protein B
MSFILDALRKSETERRRETAPDFAQVPTAESRSALPVWAWAVMVTLSIVVVVLGAAWWRLGRTPAESPQLAAPAATVARGARPNVAPAVPPRNPSVASPRAGDAAAQGASVLARRDPIDLPSVAEVQADGIALPPLELQLLSYSETPTNSFVFINGFQYRQGQRVQNGPLIVSIERNSVVLRHDGRDFLLTPD